ncbi:MAG: SGNH/GDSL hydrolase family protein [Rikenellaceae bacterium]|nr:SGNH/GDSL hydrolase family protein [Rikenellaceae bacterium]
MNLSKLTAWVLLVIFTTSTPYSAIAARRKDKIQKESPKTIVQSDWMGRKVVFLGDSITDPRGVSAPNIYWRYLADMLGFEPLVYGVNGHQWSNLPSQIKRMKEAAVVPDVIMIFAGTNDYNANVPLGEWYTFDKQVVNVNGRQVERLHREFVRDGATFRGRINSVLESLKTDYPTAQIILVTPLHRAFATFGSGNVQPEESYANGLELFIDDYVEVVREASSVWSVPVIDLYATSGLLPMIDSHVQYFMNADRDRLHPNAKGHQRMARVMAAQMLAMPAVFE